MRLEDNYGNTSTPSHSIRYLSEVRLIHQLRMNCEVIHFVNVPDRTTKVDPTRKELRK